jgi:ankyrin repeat protein
VREAHPFFGGRPVYPPGKVDVDSLTTKEEIVRAFWELTYVPKMVYETAVAGAHVLRSLKAGDVGEDPEVVGSYLYWACRAGLDLSVIRGLAEKCRKDGIDLLAAGRAATGGHTDVLDLLASEFGARIGVYCLTYASTRGRDAMIDHLVEKYGVDPNGGGEYGWTALHDAASRGRVRTVKHLIEKYNVDIHTRDRYGKTALDWAESNGMTECAAVLRGYGATNGEPVEEEAWTENDWDSDDNSDADHDVM